jgi:hypothetical protein
VQYALLSLGVLGLARVTTAEGKSTQVAVSVSLEADV